MERVQSTADYFAVPVLPFDYLYYSRYAAIPPSNFYEERKPRQRKFKYLRRDVIAVSTRIPTAEQRAVEPKRFPGDSQEAPF